MRLVILVAVVLSVSGADTIGSCRKGGPPPRPVVQDLEVRSTKGTIEAYDPASGIARIAHEDIPDYMKAMTMGFSVTPEQMKGLKPGDKVELTFTETKDGPVRITALRRLP